MSGNIKELTEKLQKLGIDTSNMSEETIIKIASIIDEMFRDKDDLTQNELQHILESLAKEPDSHLQNKNQLPTNPLQPNENNKPSDLDKNDKKPLTPSKEGDNPKPKEGKAPGTNNHQNQNINSPKPESPVNTKTPKAPSSPSPALGFNNNKFRENQRHNGNINKHPTPAQTEATATNDENKEENRNRNVSNQKAAPASNINQEQQANQTAEDKENQEDNSSSSTQTPQRGPANFTIDGVEVPDATIEGKTKVPHVTAAQQSTEQSPKKDSTNEEASEDSNNKEKKDSETGDNNKKTPNSSAEENNKKAPNKPDNKTNPNNQNKRRNPKNPIDIRNQLIDKAKERLKQNGIDVDKIRNRNRKQVVPPPVVPGNAEGTQESNQPSNNSPAPKPKSRLPFGGASPLSRVSSLLKGLTNRDRDVEDNYGNPENLLGGIKDQAKKHLKNKIKLWVVAHLPAIGIALGMLLIFFLLLVFIIMIVVVLPEEFGLGSNTDSQTTTNAQTSCTYGASANIGTSEVKNAKVEIVNCRATKSNYKVIETVSFEKYVLGVALAEMDSTAPDQSLQAQIIAARTYALTRNKGMCPGDPDNCFYGYNSKTNTFKMRGCENDQVYWDYTKDIYRQPTSTKGLALYSPEVKSGSLWKQALRPEQMARVEALAAQVRGKVLVDESGNPMQISYNSDDQDVMIEEANNGLTYDQILANKYAKNSTSAGVCQTGTIDYNNYQLNTENSGILHEPLDSFLSSKGTSIDAFNQLIDANVKKAGYGTRAAVVAAAVTLIGELNDKYQVKIPYFWGGGHEGISTYAKSSWGSTACHTYANNQNYNYCGLDCSGFVGWAIYNGGFKQVTTVAASYSSLSGAKNVNLTSSNVLNPGDLLASSSHVILIIGVDQQSGEYTCAEAKGNQYGVVFSRHSLDGDNGKYYGVDMTGFYQNQSNVRG